MSFRTLKVYANPYKTLDGEGRPCHVLPYEPEGDGVKTFDDRRFVGATLKVKVLEKFPDGDPRQTVQENTFVFSDEPALVKDTPYYRHALKRGDILPADAETARLAGLKFVEPKEALAAHRDAAVQVFENVEKHEETPEKAPDTLKSHAFGPMAEAVAARKKADDEAKEAAKKAAAAAGSGETNKTDKGGK